MPAFMQRMAPREQIVLIVMVVAAILAALVFLVFKPKVDERAALLKQQKEVQAKVDEARDALEEVRALQLSAADTRLRLSRLREAVPEDPQVPALLVDLPQLVEDSGVYLANFVPGAPGAAGTEGVPSQPVSFTVTGQFFDVLDFIYRVQNFPRYLKVSKVTVSAAATSEDDDAAATAASTGLSAQIEAMTFFTAPPAAPAAQ